MKIIIGGDFCPESRAEKLLLNKTDIFQPEYRDIWEKHDFRVLNLEGPITSSNSKIKKDGRHIKFHPDIINGINKMNVQVFSLANNHMMDFGIEGISDTIDTLNKNKIIHIGSHSNKFTIIEKDDIKVAILSFSNNEFSLLSDFSGVGVYGINLIDILSTITQAKKQTQNVIVLLHTGLSGYPYPFPNQRELCKFIIDSGANAVLCQHSHTIGAYEYYKNGFISYGQGSFVFDLNRVNSTWNKGYSVIFNYGKDSFSVEILPHKQFDESTQVRLLYGEEKKEFQDEISQYNYVLQNASLLKKEWHSYIKSKRDPLFNQLFLPKNRIIRRLFRNKNLSVFIPNRIKLIILNIL